MPTTVTCQPAPKLGGFLEDLAGDGAGAVKTCLRQSRRPLADRQLRSVDGQDSFAHPDEERFTNMRAKQPHSSGCEKSDVGVVGQPNHEVSA